MKNGEINSNGSVTYVLLAFFTNAPLENHENTSIARS